MLFNAREAIKHFRELEAAADSQAAGTKAL
jgi:hypothetical protein